MTMQPIGPEVLERAINDALAGNTALQRLSGVPDAVDAMKAAQEAEEQRNMEYRNKIDRLQFQPGGQVLQMSNWSPLDDTIDLGKILRLTQTGGDIGFPPLERTGSTLEESFLETLTLEPANRSTVARIPFRVIEERERQRQLQRNTVAGGAGARPLDIHVLGDAGLLLNTFSPILGAMNMRMGLSGGQKQPWWSAQGAAAGQAEGTAIAVSVWTLDNSELLPVTIGSGFEISSSLRAADDGTFQALVFAAVQEVGGDELTKQVLVGGGTTSNQIAGLWGRVSTAAPDNIHEYGATPGDFTRADALTTKNLVDLSKADGMGGGFILGTPLWTLAEGVLRGGTASDRYLLEAMAGMGGMGMMEGRPAYHFQDLTVSGVTNPGLYVKMDRCTVFLWGTSFNLEEVPIMSAKSQYKMVIEANLGVIQPDYNLAATHQNP